MRINRIIFFIVFTILLITCIYSASAEQSLALKLSGRILIQTQSQGQAWYVNPVDLKRNYLGNPTGAFHLMRNFGLGISNPNLFKLPVGIATNNGTDSDNDGLSDNLEKAFGTDPANVDTDSDGYYDKTELLSDYNPVGKGRLNIDKKFTKKYAGRIFLAVESHGEAWYVNPTDLRRYYLGKPTDAFNLMQKLGLGITNNDLNKILIGYGIPAPPPPPPPKEENCQASSTPNEIMSRAADAIRKKQIVRAQSCFTSNKYSLVEYTLNYLKPDGLLILGNILSGAEQSAVTDDRLTFDNEVYFNMGGYTVPLHFYVKKQPDGRWLLTNL